MPTYTCTSAEGRLSAEQKSRIASEITRIHAEVDAGDHVIALLAVVSLTIGSEPLPMRGVLDTVGARITGEPGPDPTIDVIVWDLRAPRALLAIIVGAGLALAGSSM